MSQTTAAAGQPMSFADYLALPQDLRAEYVDGQAVVNPPPSFVHQKICQRVTFQLEHALGERAEVVASAGWKLPGPADRLRIPDIMVLDQAPDGPLVTAPPLVVVEVLSTNRSDDLVRKSTEYLESGVGQYWIVDPRDRVVDVFVNTDAGWQVLARLTDDNPQGTVDVVGVTVALSLTQLLL